MTSTIQRSFGKVIDQNVLSNQISAQSKNLDRRTQLEQWRKEKQTSKSVVSTSIKNKENIIGGNIISTRSKPIKRPITPTIPSQEKAAKNDSSNKRKGSQPLKTEKKQKCDDKLPKLEEIHDREPCKELMTPQIIEGLPPSDPVQTIDLPSDPFEQTLRNGTSLSDMIQSNTTHNEGLEEKIQAQQIEIDNLQKELALLIENKDKQYNGTPLRKEEPHDLRKENKNLKTMLNQLLREKHETDKKLKLQEKKLETLESHVVELSLLYDLSKAEDPSAARSESLTVSLNREETITKLKQELKAKTEETNALRFSNEVLIQKMGDMRGKLILQIQNVHKERSDLEKEMKADSKAWSDLMTSTVKDLQNQMMSNLKSSLEKIQHLERELAFQKEENQRILEEFGLEYQSS